MLSNGELLTAYREGFSPADPHAGLRAVEAVVRADMQPREAAPSDTTRCATCGWSGSEVQTDTATGLPVRHAHHHPVQVEVTEAMVERALIALMRSEDVPTGVRPHLVEGEVLVIRERSDAEPIVRAALAAALGGGE